MILKGTTFVNIGKYKSWYILSFYKSTIFKLFFEILLFLLELVLVLVLVLVFVIVTVPKFGKYFSVFFSSKNPYCLVKLKV